MENRGKELLRSKRLRPQGLILLLLAGGLGILLLVIGSVGGREKTDPVPADSTEENGAEVLAAYTEAIEKKIAALCSGVAGVSDVRVAVTLESGYEYVYAKNAEAEERDGSVLGSYRYVTVGSGSSEQVVYLFEKPPRIGGVGIVCRGGGNDRVRRELLELISAAFGVSSNKIYITEGAG